MVQVIETDVLVVGGGGAAARAALEAAKAGARVTMIMKGRFGESGATAYKVAETAGLQAATGDDNPCDLPEGHYQDIMEAAHGMSDPRLSRILAEEAHEAIRSLESFGVRFLRDAQGSYIRSRGCFSSRRLPPRGYNVKEHAHPIVIALKDQLAKTDTRILEETMLTKLLVHNGSCAGAMAFDPKGRFVGIKAGAVVLGTGGAGSLFSLNLNPPDVTGDGYAAAYHAGAELTNMEFMQAGMGIVFPIRTLLHSWFSAPRPRLTNSQGVEFLKDYLPEGTTADDCYGVHSTHYPFTSEFPSKYIDLAIKKEILQGRGTPHHGVWADFSHLSEDQLVEMLVKSGRDKAEERWQITKAWYRSLGFDFLSGPFEISLYGHAINGGVLINEEAESSLQGLFACGETAAGPHGADRLGGNMLVTCQVFGARAGKFAAVRARETKASFPLDMIKEGSLPFPTGKASLPHLPLHQLREALQWAMWNHLLVVRTEAGMSSCLRELDRIETELLPRVRVDGPREIGQYFELMNLLQIGKIICKSARMRKESRGSHYRDDFPQKNDSNWDKSIIIRKDGDQVATSFRKLG